MILDSKFEQLVRQNFLRSTREYDLARYFWANSERAMQQKPTQQPTLTTKNLTDKERTYVTDGLAEFFAGFAWRVPQYVLDSESDQRDYSEHIKQHNFSRSELQSMQAHNKAGIQDLEEEINYYSNYLIKFIKAQRTLKDTNVQKVHGAEYASAYYDSYTETIRETKNKISSTKLKLKKLVALQTKIKRLLAV